MIKVLELNAEMKALTKGLGFELEVSGSLGDEVNEVLLDKEIEEIRGYVSKIAEVVNKAFKRDLEKEFLKEIEDTLKPVKELRDELYNSMSDESKAKADKLKEDLSKLKTDEEKADRVLQEILGELKNLLK